MPKQLPIFIVSPDVIICPRDISETILVHVKDKFIAVVNNKVVPIHNYNVDSLLQRLTTEELKSILQNGNIKMSQSSNGEYRLGFALSLLGGGPATGRVFGIGVKVIGWSAVTIGCIATAVGVAIGGAAAAPATVPAALTGGSAVSGLVFAGNQIANATVVFPRIRKWINGVSIAAELVGNFLPTP